MLKLMIRSDKKRHCALPKIQLVSKVTQNRRDPPKKPRTGLRTTRAEPLLSRCPPATNDSCDSPRTNQKGGKKRLPPSHDVLELLSTPIPPSSLNVVGAPFLRLRTFVSRLA